MIGLYIVIYMIIQSFYLIEFLVSMISYGAFYFLVTLNASFTLQTRKRWGLLTTWFRTYINAQISVCKVTASTIAHSRKILVFPLQHPFGDWVPHTLPCCSTVSVLPLQWSPHSCLFLPFAHSMSDLLFWLELLIGLYTLMSQVSFKW